MIRAIAPLVLLLGLLALLPGGSPGILAPDGPEKIRSEAHVDPILRRADQVEPADDPAAPLRSGLATRVLRGRICVSPRFTIPPSRHRVPIRARSPPAGTV